MVCVNHNTILWDIYIYCVFAEAQFWCSGGHCTTCCDSAHLHIYIAFGFSCEINSCVEFVYHESQDFFYFFSKKVFSADSRTFIFRGRN